jgi:KIX domain
MTSTPEPAGGAEDGPEWRLAVAQSYRNGQVRQIAKVLADLEPGATEASKLRLAMQFEQAIFGTATGLADYHKRLTKRLKKLQKSYVPAPAAASNETKKEPAIQELIQKYGADVQYVVQNAVAAVKEMREKYGDEKGTQLQQHMDGVKLWAADLGLLGADNKPNWNMSEAHLERLKTQLEKRLPNVRAHTVKLVHPDLYLKESLQKLQDDFKNKGRAVRLQAEQMRQRHAQWNAARRTSQTEPSVDLTKAWEQVSKPVRSVPSTNQRLPVEVALAHLDQMRAASTLCLAYLLADDKYSVPPNALAQAHTVATDGIQIVQTAMREHRQAHPTVTVQLSDAWLKPIPTPPSTKSPDDTATVPLLPLKTRLLCTSGRKTPSNLVAALHAKGGVNLVRPLPHGAGSYVQISIKQVLIVRIYFCPLLITIRAYSKDDGKNEGGQNSWLPWNSGFSELSHLPADAWIVEEHLKDASAHATQVLRQCFAKAVSPNETTAKSDFDLELLEASALLEFVQLVRDTYLPPDVAVEASLHS